MKFVTFNIRRDFDFDKELRFLYRKDFIEEKLRQEQADILCFQEVLPDAKMWLKKILPEYDVLGCGRDEVLESETAVVAYKKEKFDLISMSTFWLSETPNVPGSRYEDQSDCPRTCTAVLLKELDTGLIFRVYNTHLDHVGSSARMLGVKQILEQKNKETLFPDAPILFTGDFNATPDAPEIVYISEKEDWVDYTEDLGITFHNYGKEEYFVKIDYIFGDKSWNCIKKEKWTDRKGELYLSDHYPVCVELERK